MKTEVYGKVFKLLKTILHAECWNYTDNKWADLEAGTEIKVEHVNDATHTTVMVQKKGGVPVYDNDGKLYSGSKHYHAKETRGVIVGQFSRDEGGTYYSGDNGYRFIVENQALAKAIGVKMPKKTRDVVGEIINYEGGNATPKQAARLMNHLRKTGLGKKLQGHYSSKM